MAREDFDRALVDLESRVVLLGGMVETAVMRALKALEDRDLEESRRVIEDDDQIDDQRFEIEEACIELVRREAPIARDLRRIMSILFIASELERMGDYAEGIAKISLAMGDEPPLKELIDIPRMVQISVGMLKRSLEAFLERDPERVTDIAASLGPDDGAVNDLYDTVKADLIELMKADPDNVERVTYLVWLGHNIERMADRATNIAERAVFQATGDVVRVSHDAPAGAPALRRWTQPGGRSARR
ncbi:MAG: phosphate signaling complex protein PhoU [Gemmatimonadetes bacterium]|nr:phosphate signaling complex protein PhoU [Gemmatimonadota bacterium]